MGGWQKERKFTQSQACPMFMTLVKHLELWQELSRGVPRGGAPGCPGGWPRAASGRTFSPSRRPAELPSLQGTAPEGFGSSSVSNSSSFTSCRIKLTKAASSRLGRRSFSSKPSRQSGQPARCLPSQYRTMQGRQKLWVQPVSRTGSLKYCRQQVQLSSTALRSRSRATAAAMARPGPGRSWRLSSVSPGRLLPPGAGRAPGRAGGLRSAPGAGMGPPAGPRRPPLPGATLRAAPPAGQKAQRRPGSASAGHWGRGFGVTGETNWAAELALTWP